MAGGVAGGEGGELLRREVRGGGERGRGGENGRGGILKRGDEK